MDRLINEFLRRLSDGDRNHVKILDAYFSRSSNIPIVFGILLKLWPKTTQQIQDDLISMASISNTLIVNYLIGHGYTTVLDNDGTVMWKIYKIDLPQLE